MTQTLSNINTYLRTEIKGYDLLEKLALDLVWSWSHRADKIWIELDPVLWKLTHNAWIILQTVSKEKLELTLADPIFQKELKELVENNEREAAKPVWFQQTYPQTALKNVAYFSMEFMLSEALPIYSGGLGNVAGDQLKTANDLGVPVIGVGLLYQQGYFRQVIDKNGQQQALYPYNDPGQLPIVPLRKSNGEWLRLEIVLPGWSIWLRAWQVKIGRVKLYLLDSNDAANFPAYRGITSELYGGGSELRLMQELVLGLGGLRLLDELGIKPEVCHLNEGHAGFVVLERAYRFMQATGQPFEVALAATRVGNLFTTHTAVPAGFDLFSPDLLEQYLGNYVKNKLDIPFQDMLALGRLDRNNRNEPFNMAYLAIRGSGAINGVSSLHGTVSRHIFTSLFPRWPENEIPIEHVTNGVHMPTWDSASSDAFWEEICGVKRWLIPTECLEKVIKAAPDTKIWKMRNESRKALVDYSRDRLTHELAVRGSPPEKVEQAKHLLDPHTLTLGFARRFATYKRPNLLLQDPERLLKILTNPQRPVQLLIAGKAHPHDIPGQLLIQEWMRFIERPEARKHVIFLSDYDILLSEQLVQGVDVWINTPRRPWEACGTSGMKVLVNGGINVSELDGWWAEAYSPDVGWSLGDGIEHGPDPSWDASEAATLYEILENQIIPCFYARNNDGIPVEWIEKIRASMAELTPRFSSNRSVREYTEKYYLNLAKNYFERTKDRGQFCQKLIAWEKEIQKKWEFIRFGELKTETNATQHILEVQVYLDNLDPSMVKVEVYAGGFDGNTPFAQEMELIHPMSGTENMYIYRTAVSNKNPIAFYTPRIVPCFPGALVPLECNKIIWLR